MYTAAHYPASVEGEEFPGHFSRAPVYGGCNALKRNLMPIAGEDVHSTRASATLNCKFHAGERPFAMLKEGERFALQAPAIYAGNGHSEPNRRQTQRRCEDVMEQIQIRRGQFADRSRWRGEGVGKPFGVEPSETAVSIECQDIRVGRHGHFEPLVQGPGRPQNPENSLPLHQRPVSVMVFWGVDAMQLDDGLVYQSQSPPDVLQIEMAREKRRAKMQRGLLRRPATAYFLKQFGITDNQANGDGDMQLMAVAAARAGAGAIRSGLLPGTV